MVSDQKTFSELPLDIVANIVEGLDFVSQMQLRRVSRGLRNIVDRVKPSVDCLRISHDQDSVTITYSVKKHKRSSFSYSGEKYYEKALNDMKILLKNPRLRLESFHWRGTLESEDFLESLQLEVTELSTYHLPRDSVVALLSAIKPGALKALDFKFSTDLKKFDRFAELDQWKQAKRVRIRSLFEDFFGYFHYFQHFEMVSVRVKEISMDDLVIMRNVFSSKVNFKHCVFKTKNTPPTRTIEEQLGLSDVHEDRRQFSARYSIPDSSKDYLLFTAIRPYFSIERKSAN